VSDFDLIQPGLATAPDTAPVIPKTPSRSARFADYLFGDELASAVNVAIHLGRPLLVTGEPGTGKTALAWAIALRLGLGDVLEFHAKSTSTAQDLLYTVDNLRRFYDANTGGSDLGMEQYITWQALGRSIRSDSCRVLLIDEIDKAPRDFPNDLLNELDRMEFSVPELGPDVRYSAKVAHVVLITSNSERRLPLPFLRRCVYHHIPFPEAETLRTILETHTRSLQLSDGFLDLVVRRFLELREVQGLTKPPATDELIAWTGVLAAMGVSEEQINGPLESLPGLEALIKLRDDMVQVKSQA